MASLKGMKTDTYQPNLKNISKLEFLLVPRFSL